MQFLRVYCAVLRATACLHARSLPNSKQWLHQLRVNKNYNSPVFFFLKLRNEPQCALTCNLFTVLQLQAVMQNARLQRKRAFSRYARVQQVQQRVCNGFSRVRSQCAVIHASQCAGEPRLPCKRKQCFRKQVYRVAGNKTVLKHGLNVCDGTIIP